MFNIIRDIIITWGDIMNQDDIKFVLKVVVFFTLIVLAFKFFIYLLPFIIIALVIMFAYDVYKNKNVNKKTSVKKEKEIKEAEIIKEVKD